MVCQKSWYMSRMELDVTSVKREEIFNGKSTRVEVSVYSNVLLCRGNANINKQTWNGYDMNTCEHIQNQKDNLHYIPAS